MDKNDILDYVTETPGNTNRAVLGSMLDSFSSGDGGGTVEVSKIKIATVQGGVNQFDSTTQMRVFNLMGAINDGKTLSDVIGDKSIVGVVGADSNDGEDYMLNAFATSKVPHKNLIGISKAEADQTKGIGVIGITYSASFASGSPLDIYAICI